MPRKKSGDLTKHTLWLRRGDVEVLQDAYPKTGASGVIRHATSRIVDDILSRRTSTDLNLELDLTEPPNE